MAKTIRELILELSNYDPDLELYLATTYAGPPEVPLGYVWWNELEECTVLGPGPEGQEEVVEEQEEQEEQDDRPLLEILHEQAVGEHREETQAYQSARDLAAKLSQDAIDQFRKMGFEDDRIHSSRTGTGHYATLQLPDDTFVVLWFDVKDGGPEVEISMVAPLNKSVRKLRYSDLLRLDTLVSPIIRQAIKNKCKQEG